MIGRQTFVSWRNSVAWLYRFGSKESAWIRADCLAVGQIEQGCCSDPSTAQDAAATWACS
jgi:hypothetical protein